jgi:Domain of unknown function (DUF4190)
VAQTRQPPAIPPPVPTPPPGWGPPLGPLPPGPPRPPRNDRAVLALILGIGGLVAFFGARLGLFFFFNLPPAIAAWIVGVDARRRIARGETPEGASAAQAGVVLGVIGTLLGLLAIVGWALVLALSPDRRGLLMRILAG